MKWYVDFDAYISDVLAQVQHKFIHGDLRASYDDKNVYIIVEFNVSNDIIELTIPTGELYQGFNTDVSTILKLLHTEYEKIAL